MSTSYAGPVLAWYARNARDLPWRAPGATPWAVLVSEIMLQQTPVARVLPEYLRWMVRWPTPAALAAEPAGEAIRQWGRLGYPRRALRQREQGVHVRGYGPAVPRGYDGGRLVQPQRPPRIPEPAGSAAGVGHRASQLWCAGTTRASGVCCSMISLTSTDQGVAPGPRHGRSRAWRENQSSTGSA